MAAANPATCSNAGPKACWAICRGMRLAKKEVSMQFRGTYGLARQTFLRRKATLEMIQVPRRRFKNQQRTCGRFLPTLPVPPFKFGIG
jgi:hypothetical protein